MSVSYDKEYNILSSWRTQNGTRHIISKLQTNNTENSNHSPPQLVQLHEYLGSPQKTLARSRVLNFRKKIIFATGDQNSASAVLHQLDIESDCIKTCQKLPIESGSVVMDIVAVGGGIAVLTNSKLHLWR